MKFTLAFDVFNKEEWIQSLLESWLDNLSGRHAYEVIIVFDACKDASPGIAERILRQRRIPYRLLYANDEYEIFCNDLAFRHASGDYILFIQDDNWMFDKQWDDTLAETLLRVHHAGAVGLLGGLELQRSTGLKYRRIEVKRLHKTDLGCSREDCELAIWSVDAVCRPFGISTALLREIGGLDFAFRPTCGDDLDLSMKLLRRNHTNLYIPFDVKNVTASNTTVAQDFIRKAYARAFELNWMRHGDFILRRVGSCATIIYELKDTVDGLRLGRSLYPIGYGIRMQMARHPILPVGFGMAYKGVCRTRSLLKRGIDVSGW